MKYNRVGAVLANNNNNNSHTLTQTETQYAAKVNVACGVDTFEADSTVEQCDLFPHSTKVINN